MSYQQREELKAQQAQYSNERVFYAGDQIEYLYDDVPRDTPVRQIIDVAIANRLMREWGGAVDTVLGFDGTKCVWRRQQ